MEEIDDEEELIAEPLPCAYPNCNQLQHGNDRLCELHRERYNEND